MSADGAGLVSVGDRGRAGDGAAGQLDTVAQRRRHRGPATALRRAGPDRRRVPADQAAAGPPSLRLRAGHLLGHVERALLLQVLPAAPAPARRQGAAQRRAAGRHRAERGRGGHRPGLRGHLQDRVAQPPVLRGAVPGRGHRGGRDRPRHPGHGRPAGGGHGRAAVRPGRRARHRPGAARRGRRHLLLRQLPRPAQHRRRAGLRSLLRGQPAGERPVRGGHAARGPAARGRPRRGQQGHPVRRRDRPGRHRRRLGAGQRLVRRR